MTSAIAAIDAETATRALADGCREVGLDPAGATLLRIGSSAVFRLATEPVVVRVGRTLERVQHAVVEVGVSRWLKASGVPAVRAVDVPQPVEVDGRVVTVWESVSDAAYGSTSDLACLIRQLHQVDEPADLELPALAPFDRAFNRLRTVQGMSTDARRFLLDRCERLAAEYDELVYALPAGVVHGDASVGNVLRDDRGQAVLADLDGFAIGAREWDLVLTALYYERLGWHSSEEYAAFVDVYGWDVMTWSGYPVLRDTRELLMVTWLAQNAADNEKVRSELSKRIDTLRTGASRHTWSPF